MITKILKGGFYSKRGQLVDFEYAVYMKKGGICHLDTAELKKQYEALERFGDSCHLSDLKMINKALEQTELDY